MTEIVEQSAGFEARMTGPATILKVASDDGKDRFLIWGKASVEVVDKENDKITAEALKDALPQLLRRKRLSLEHTDQLVGDIREKIETDEPVTVEIDGKEYERTEFPTDVLKFEGEEPALFVAGEIWDDSRQAKEVRDQIEAGVIDSYSISGEAISTSTKIKDGDAYDEISELDLSAVTLCEEGMNQKAKFGTVVKSIRVGDDSVSPTNLGWTSTPDSAVAKSNMTDKNDDETGDGGDTLTREDLRGEFQKAVEESLADADFVTADDVKSIVDTRLEREDDEEDGPNNASDAAGDEDDDAEKADDESDAEKGDDMDYPESEDEYEGDDDDDEGEDEKAVDDDVQAAVNTISEFVAAQDDEDDDDVDVVDPDEIEDPDDDDEEEVDLDPELDDEDEMPEEKGDLVGQLEEAGVPDDLVDAVSEYVEADEPEDDMEMPDEGEEVELSDDDGAMDGEGTEKNEPIGGDDIDDLSKAADDQQYLDMTASGAVPATPEDADLMKSFEHESEDGVDDEPGTLTQLYKDLGEEV